MSQDPLNSPEHELFRETVRKFTEQELRPRAREFDEMGRFDKSLFKKMGDLGMLGLRYDPRYGGSDETMMHYPAKQLGFQGSQTR